MFVRKFLLVINSHFDRSFWNFMIFEIVWFFSFLKYFFFVVCSSTPIQRIRCAKKKIPKNLNKKDIGTKIKKNLSHVTLIGGRGGQNVQYRGT